MDHSSTKEASTELNAFLSDLRAVGAADSADGTFTLSPQSAVKTMARFRLPDPQMYVLQMIAAAEIAPLERLSIETAPRTLKFLFHGLQIPAGELRVLDTYLFPLVDAPPHLVELAVGIAAALHFAEEVCIESSSPDGWWRLVISPKAVKLEPLKHVTEEPICRIIIRKRLDVGALWKARRHPELIWLETCRHASIKIEVDAKEYKTERLPPLPMGTILWARIDKPGEITKVQQRGHGAEVLPPSAVTEYPDITGYLTLSSRESAYKSGLIFIHRGLVVHRPLMDLGTHVIAGVIRCDKLKKDLSHTNFVEDAEFESVRLFLKNIGYALVTEFCRHPYPHQKRWKYLWATVVTLLKNGELTTSQETVIRAWATLVHQTGESQSPFSSLQKARFLETENRLVEARKLRWTLLDEVRKEMLSQFETGRFENLPENGEILQGVCYDLACYSSKNLKLANRFIQALLNTEIDSETKVESSDPLTLHRLALIRRWQNDLPGAIEFHLAAIEHPEADDLVRGWGIRYCAELEFSQQRYRQADELYGLAELELPKQRDLWEERAFFKRFLGQAHKDESFAYLRRAIEGVQADSFVHWLLVEEIKAQGRSILTRAELAALQTKSTYLKLKRLLEEGDPAQIEATLKENLDLGGWITREELMSRKIQAVRQAEHAFGPTYLYTRYCRRRCVYQLHRMGALKEAEHLQCRGHLLEHLRMLLLEVPTSTEIRAQNG